jgi:molybdopterin biosynthesis enzyme
VVDLGIARDDEADIRAKLAEGAERCDAVLTSGGVSMGDFDYVKKILNELAAMAWMQVAIRPAKPFAFGRIGATPVFGLPGNPVSSLVGCELFAKPALRALQGLREPLPRFEPGRLATPLRRNAARDELVRARSRLDADGVVVEPLSGQESHMIARAASANALVFVPRGDGELKTGDHVSYLPV